MPLRVMASRHSAFYSPLIATIARGFPATYAILGPGQRSHELIRDGAVDVMQSAVSSNWKPMERGEAPLPVHFALINRRDGFFLAGRERGADFAWNHLEGKSLLADHGGQPLAMLRYAARYNGVEWSKIEVLDRGTPEEMLHAFRRGEGDYVHLQAPGPQLLEEDNAGWTMVSVGASMPEVAFSTLCCSRDFLGTAEFTQFFAAYKDAREWVRGALPGEVAALEASFFPGVSPGALAEAVRRYQELGNWSGGVEITKELYDQALRVFGADQPFSAVCV
jgi:ABC-type nitrate/sulfonate/bicarbonate transport system substrate-binding protein